MEIGLGEEKWCDGIRDCTDGSDETNCTMSAKGQQNKNKIDRKVNGYEVKSDKLARVHKNTKVQDQ